MPNRRNYERLLIRRYALLKLANGETITGETRNMSMGGVFVECEQDGILDAGTECSISLTLGDDGDEMTTETSGSICHIDSEGIGLFFVKVNATYYQFISNASY